MNLDSQQIELIVREVLRHLETTHTSGGGPPSSDAVPTGEASVAALVVEDRLVTTASLDRDLSSIQQLVVRHDAVITPLVVDMMREYGITIQRQSPQGRPSAGQCEVGLYCDADEASETRRRLGSLPVVWRPVRNIEQVLAQPAGVVIVAVTQRWAEWVSRANQAGHVTVSATSVACLRDARRQIHPTVLVVNPRSTVADEQVQLIEEFIKQVG